MPVLSVRAFALDEVGDRDAPEGSRPWAVWALGETLLIRDRLDFEARELADMLSRLKEAHAFQALGFESLDALCAAKLKLDAEQVHAVLQAKRGQTLGAVLRRVGRPKGGEGKAYNVSLRPGNQAAYLAARLRRDHPDAVFDETVRGSVRKAAIEAGIVKVPSGLDRLRRAWDRATDDEREEFCRAVGLR
jgi:hypothetical protein